MYGNIDDNYEFLISQFRLFSCNYEIDFLRGGGWKSELQDFQEKDRIVI